MHGLEPVEDWQSAWRNSSGCPNGGPRYGYERNTIPPGAADETGYRTPRLVKLPASIRHTADSGAVALACLPLEREPRQPVPCQPLPRAAIVRSHSPIGDRVQKPLPPSLAELLVSAALVGGVALCLHGFPLLRARSALLRSAGGSARRKLQLTREGC
jgi:hypothetical protein